ncbi:MAG: HD domain-containing protein [Thermodesulfobacteriota bacterium]
MLDAARIDHATVKLADFVDTSDPQCVLAEVKATARLAHPDLDLKILAAALEDAERLFAGRYPGYRRSNTKYHDLKHTLEVMLATARLLHGAHAAGRRVSPRTMRLGLLAALFHDVGLIQTEDDTVGTGAKYTIGHEKRSVNFVERYLREHAFPEDEIRDIGNIIAGTNLSQKFHEIAFGQDELLLAGQIVAAADLLAQMADREYLEKLLLLYLEFQEAGLPYDSMFDLLQRTHGFYAMATDRQERILGGVYALMAPHFAARWDLPRDLYSESIAQNMSYLKDVLELGPENYMSKLKRGGIVQRLHTPGSG